MNGFNEKYTSTKNVLGKINCTPESKAKVSDLFAGTDLNSMAPVSMTFDSKAQKSSVLYTHRFQSSCKVTLWSFNILGQKDKEILNGYQPFIFSPCNLDLWPNNPGIKGVTGIIILWGLTTLRQSMFV